ncbi:MAG: right-handed parallel beta-helix repeat-containing protein [Verrucomicrobia bacterium]|nr:right-handed parallel beta-helix repeat-containing protein [Verrucomicrobiota bacterium]
MLTLTAVLSLQPAAEANGRTFFVAASGNDAGDGLSRQSPWRSLDKVNAATLEPGDKVFFRRGDTWRGQLVAQSGEEGSPITYAAYGQGAKPLLLGSISHNSPHDWHHEGGNIWATAKPAFTELEPLGNFAAVKWNVHTEGGAKVRTTKADGASELECTSSGSKGNHIQFYGCGFSVREGDYFALAFRARSTKPFTIRSIGLSTQGAPWTSYGRRAPAGIEVGPEWTDCAARFKATKTASDGRITFHLGGALPAGATLCLQPVSWKRLRCNEADLLSVDVGNIIFDHGKSAGVKKWKPADLKQQGDYWYDGANWQVKLCSEKNPAELHKSIELALRRHNVDQGGESYVIYENLAVSCGAAHGFGGGSTRGIVIRDCDISWIGGGHQFTTPQGKPVRFGNGIEFWSNARDCLVEGCRLWEIYDAALTNQGSGTNQQINITYRDNVIWNSEYSFEYWNRGPASVTRNIRFEHNTCVNAGFGWGHAQRPDRNGRHLMFYTNPAQTSEFYVRDNIFCNATDSALRMMNDWTAGLTMDHNCWFQRGDVLMLFLKSSFSPAQFAEFQKQSKLDAHSIVADPKFVNADKLDFRLADDSPARKLATDGGPVGSRRRLQCD